jgi:PAS domain S-box-containing protein
MKSAEDIIGLLTQGFDFESFLSEHVNGLLTVGTAGEILLADLGASRLFGFQPSELEGQGLAAVLPYLGSGLTGDDAQGATTGLHRTGRELNISYTLRKSGSGASFLLLHCKSSVAQSIELYAHMFEWIPVGILVYSLAGQKPLKCNRALLDLFEAKDEAEFLRCGPFSDQPNCPQNLGKLDALLQALPQESDQHFELLVHWESGREQYLDITTALIPALNESLILLLFKDVTQRKKDEARLRESRRTLEAVIDTAVDGIIIIDGQSNEMLLTNDAVSTLFGYSKEEMRGQNVNMLMPMPHRARHDEYIENYRRTGDAKIIGIGREVQGRRKDGTLFPFKLGVSRVETEDRVIFTGVIHDLSEQKQAEAHIRKLNQELELKVEERTEKLTEVVNKLLQSNLKLEQEISERKSIEAALRHNEEELRKSLEREKELNKLKSRFVSMASHEFRTPLTTIASSSELIGLYTQSEQQDKRDKHLRRIRSAVANLTGILGDFLSLSKLEEGKILKTPVAFRLEELAEEACEEMQSLLKPGQHIQKDFPDTGADITLDKKMLKNIFLNLLSNAVKYSEGGCTIYFNLSLDGDRIHASVRDEGIGIPEEEQAQLFTRFFRATNAVNIQGTGLGLNIVRRYLDILDGSIRFESFPGRGTTFFVEIPLEGKA